MIQDVPQVVPEEEFLAFWEASKSSGRLMVDPSAESSEEMESHLAGVRTGARRDAKGWFAFFFVCSYLHLSFGPPPCSDCLP